MDYFVNEFRGPTTFVALRYGLPIDAIKNLGFKMKPYRTQDGRELYTLAPWEGSAFQVLGLGLSLGEATRPSWGRLLRNIVDIEVDFAGSKGLPGFLSESYTGDGTQYTGSVGIPDITVSPRARITDAASLYTLGVAYSIAPSEVEGFLEANWPVVSTLLTDHGPWEGYNVARREPIKFQTTAHTLALILGLIGQGSANMHRYLESNGLSTKLAGFFEAGPGADLLASSPAFAWTSKDATLASGKEGAAFHVKGDQLPLFGIAWVPDAPEGVNLSGGMLTLRYKSAQALDPVTIELKPVKDPSMDDSGLISRAITVRIEATGSGEKEVRVPLPATPGLAHIKEVVLYHERSAKGSGRPVGDAPLGRAHGPEVTPESHCRDPSFPRSAWECPHVPGACSGTPSVVVIDRFTMRRFSGPGFSSSPLPLGEGPGVRGAASPERLESGPSLLNRIRGHTALGLAKSTRLAPVRDGTLDSGGVIFGCV